MAEKSRGRITAWRSPSGDGRVRDKQVITEKDSTASCRERIAVLVEEEGNRHQLIDVLSSRYQVFYPGNDQSLPRDFDLALVDIAGLRRWRPALNRIKYEEQPIFSPVMLLLPRSNLRRRSSTYWDVVDEFIVSPIDPREFIERAALLLRIRRLSREQQDELAHLLNYDNVTGLPNERIFLEHLQSGILYGGPIGRKVCAIVIDLPLASIRESLGSQARQEAAKEWTKRLCDLVGKDATIARLSSDCWGMIATAGSSADGVLALCRRIAAAAQQPIDVKGERVALAPRFGIGVYPDDATRAEDILNAAFSAVAVARQSGESRFYSRSAQARAVEYLRVEADLPEALARQQFELWYQPQVNLADRGLCGAEALIRWRLPSGELVPPGNFLPVAEASGFIQRIDQWVLETACHDLAATKSQSQAPRVAINVTPIDLASKDFVPRLRESLQRHGAQVDQLELELTETMFCEVDESTLKIIKTLKDLGITVAMDDFGTGYSSLSYLHQLPIDIIKIDKSFIDGLPHDARSRDLTKAIVALARRFHLQIVAEGIETEKQADYLCELDVPIGQGFLFSKPIPVSEWLSSLRH